MSPIITAHGIEISESMRVSVDSAFSGLINIYNPISCNVSVSSLNAGKEIQVKVDFTDASGNSFHSSDVSDSFQLALKSSAVKIKSQITKKIGKENNFR